MSTTIVPKEESDSIFAVLRAQKANKMCFDCQASSPTWTSITYGVYICYNCSSAHRNMGVHLSFVRSTNLDTWRSDHLRRMKVGGNAAATEFFTRHGGSLLLSEGNTKKKYESRVAELYRAELDKREKADAAMFPAGVVVEGVVGTGVGAPATSPAEAKEDDFFDSWDKPASPKPKATNGSATVPAKPPGINRAKSASPSSAPRTVTSASLLASSSATGSAKPARLGLGAARLNSASSTGSAGAAKKLGGLKGAAKAVAPIDFEKAQRDAEAEEARIKQLGYDRKKEEEAAAAAAASSASSKAAPKSSTEIGGPAKTSLSNAPSIAPGNAKLVGHQRGSSQDVTRLGMGMKRLGLGAAAASPATTPSSPVASEGESTYAREHFANQKGISSDMYFGRGLHDPTRSAEAQARLAQFQGASSISSASYFGRDEEEEAAMRSLGEGGLLGDGSLEGVQAAARDALQRVMSNPDVQNGVETLRQGAMKLSEYLAQMGER